MTPEEMQAEILRLQEENKTQKSTLDTLTKYKEDSDKTITELRDFNMKLFLQTQNKEKEEEKKDEEPKITIDEVIQKLKI